MSTVKYTADGRKVVVVGKLNSQETIVQEVYVDENGNELSAGEEFVVRSLVDVPAVSWKQKQINVLEETYTRKTKELEQQIKLLDSERSKIGNHLRYLVSITKNAKPEQFETMIGILSGELKYCVVDSYGSYKLLTTQEALNSCDTEYGEHRFDGFRMLSMYGKTNGEFDFRIGSYSDLSGSYQGIYFFKTEQEALNTIIEKLNSKEKYSDSDILFFKKYSITPNKEKLHSHIDEKIKYHETKIDEKTTEIDKTMNIIKNLRMELVNE